MIRAKKKIKSKNLLLMPSKNIQVSENNSSTIGEIDAAVKRPLTVDMHTHILPKDWPNLKNKVKIKMKKKSKPFNVYSKCKLHCFFIFIVWLWWLCTIRTSPSNKKMKKERIFHNFFFFFPSHLCFIYL